MVPKQTNNNHKYHFLSYKIAKKTKQNTFGILMILTSTKSNTSSMQSAGAKVTLCDILSTSSDTDEHGGAALQDEGFASCSDVASNSPDSFVFSSNQTASFDGNDCEGRETGDLANTAPHLICPKEVDYQGNVKWAQNA